MLGGEKSLIVQFLCTLWRVERDLASDLELVQRRFIKPLIVNAIYLVVQRP